LKKILFLGAAHHQCPAIRYAKSRNYYVLTLDNLPTNPGHQLADECFNCSTTSKESVLGIARKNNIDGIVAYASDPAASTAAFVSDHLGLPGNPFESVKVLNNKDQWRKFLLVNKFNVPKFSVVNSVSDLKNKLKSFEFPVFIKPVDSSGSKGITQISSIQSAAKAYNHAKSFSLSGNVIIEEKIYFGKNQIAGDGFIIDKKLKYKCFADENFNSSCNGIVPIGQTFPSSLTKDDENLVHQETQRIINLLNLNFGALNFDFVFDVYGNLYFLELGPRNGGCRIPEVIKYYSGLNMIALTVENAVGNTIQNNQEYLPKGFWASYMIHSKTRGIFHSIDIDKSIKESIIETEIWTSKGDQVFKYDGSNRTLGTCILNFDSRESMSNFFSDPCEYIKVNVT
jgi:biotin carboxylase